MKKGGHFEELVAGSLALIHSHTIRRVEPPVKAVKWFPDGKFLGCYSGSGALDFAGCRRGRHVEFDCKETRTSLKFDGRMVSENCLKNLVNLQSCGAICGIAVRFIGGPGVGDECYGIDADYIFRILRGRKSISLAMCRDSACDHARDGVVSLGPLVNPAKLILWIDRQIP